MLHPHADAKNVRASIEVHVAGVLDGSVPSNHWLRLAARRWVADLERPELRMDWDEVGRLVEFIEGLRLVGGHAGESWTLLPWQRWVLASACGWRWSDGTPRTRMLLLQVARKNGKSTLMAGLALWELVGRAKPGRAVHVIANKREQARIVLDTARDMARPMLPEKTSTGSRCIQHNRVVCDWGFLDSQTAAEKSLDGLNPSMWIVDEVSEWRGRFVTKLTTATVGRDDALGCLITTPGNNPDLVYPELVNQCERMLEGELRLDDWQAFIYGVDDEDAIEDTATWGKANQSLGAALKLSTLERQWETMQLTPMGRVEFTRFHLARAVDVAGRWLEMQHWDAITEPADLPDGAEVWMGVDLSKSLDMSAVVLARPVAGGVVHLMGRYWYPEEHAREREITYQMPFRRWAMEGRLRLSPGREIDWGAIVEEIRELSRRYRIRQVAVDPWMAAYFIETLKAAGLPVVEHPQSIGVMGPAAQDWQNLWVGRKLRHGDDPILRTACANAAVKTDEAGNVRPSKAHSRGLIDPLIAAMMAVHSWALSQGTAPSMYEDGAGVG